MPTSRHLDLYVIVIAATLSWAPAQGASLSWNGSASDDWFDANNWTPAQTPAAGDDVTIGTGTSLLTNATAILGSLTVTNAILTFSNWTTVATATNVIIENGGTVTVPPAYTNGAMSNRVWFACTNLTINAGGSIDVAGLGYQGGIPDGPGHGPAAGLSPRAGAGHGGGGGSYVNDGQGGMPYGSDTAPEAPGSGGAGANVDGGDGGGAVRIDAPGGTVTVDGILTASGGSAPSFAGGASGGSIFITCRVFAGSNGVVSADGGTVGYFAVGGGGGGRIAVVYDPTAQAAAALPSVQFSARPSPYLSGYPDYSGDLGTLRFPDARFVTPTVNHQANWLVGPVALTNLVVSNQWFRFGGDGATVTVSNDIVVTGNKGRFDLGGGGWWNDCTNTSYGVAAPTLLVGGDLVVTNRGQLWVFGAATNGAPEYGALVSVTGSLVIASNSIACPVSHPTNGGSALFRVTDLLVASNGAFSATARGFSGGELPSDGQSYDGYGPGGGRADLSSPSGHGAGGSHGGRGGDGVAGSLRLAPSAYGSATSPADAGSGGGSGNLAVGGMGGGVVRVEASGTVTVDGTVAADAYEPAIAYRGGGAGGSIFVTCNVIRGVGGRVSASGGRATLSGGSGGGGRIAVIFNTVAQAAEPLPQITFSARNGIKTGLSPNWLSTRDRDNYFGRAVGDIGTLHFSDDSFLTRADLIAHSGIWIAAAPFTSWAPSHLTVSGGVFRLAQDGFALTLTNDLTVTDGGQLELTNGTLLCNGDLVLTNGTLLMHGSSTARPSVTVHGDLRLTMGGELTMHSGMTNAVTPDYGGLVQVSGDMILVSNSWIYPHSHPTNGGSVLFTCGNLNIASADSGFNADGLGWEIGGDGSGDEDGLGPGFGYGSSGYRATGGGYGGRGGRSTSVTNRGAIYGSSNAPVHCGSSGGSGSDIAFMGGNGGGLVRLEATHRITVNGIISANSGVAVNGKYGGGGSGGGVYLRCRAFTGDTNGVIRAKGGNSGFSTVSGAGGGGRIAIWRTAGRDTYLGSFSVTNGVGNTTGPEGNTAEVGTIVLVDLPVEGTLLILR